MADLHSITGALFDSPVPPEAGWPDDPAITATPVAYLAADVACLADASSGLSALDARTVVRCACDRFVAWREKIARTGHRASFAHEPYWGRPAASVGSENARIYVVGLVPVANGVNRIGRMLTGNHSGDWLQAALHRAGLAASPTSTTTGDGQRLTGTRMDAVVRCAPLANKPTTVEWATCTPWFAREVVLMPEVGVLLVPGGIRWGVVLRVIREAGWILSRLQPRFGHETTAELTRLDDRAVTLLGNYHPSQQNTFTGRLTEAMFDDVLEAAKYPAET